MSAAGALAAVTLASSHARAQAQGMRARAAALRVRAALEHTVGHAAVHGARSTTRWTSSDCIALENFVAACGGRSARYAAQAVSAESAAADACEYRHHWETLRRGLLRRAARRSTTCLG